MIEGLENILSKEIIISTASSDDLLHRPQDIEGYYLHHVRTIIPTGEIPQILSRIQKYTEEKKTPIGYIVAEYGYGKTSTMLFLWNAIEEKQFVGVPPFQFSSLMDILRATYGWLKFKLTQNYPDLIEELDRVYEKYALSTIEDMAVEHAKSYGISNIAAKRILQDLFDQKKLILEIKPTSLVRFLKEATEIAEKSKFKGLIIFADEFQQYIKKQNLFKELQELREFIWDLDNRKLPLGLIISMPSSTEGALNESAEDILHRLKGDNIYYRLDDIYTRNFPAVLWEKYSKAFDLGDSANKILDAYALESIGQIAERNDLGEGPRTIIDAFKHAINFYKNEGQTYTPIQFISDILQGYIAFQTHAMRSAINKVLNMPLIRSEKEKRAIMLIAAFPYGCRPEVQKFYGFYETITNLSNTLHGGPLTYLAEGYALSEYQKKQVGRVDKILTEFWAKYKHQEDSALKLSSLAFVENIIPSIFNARKGTAVTGWKNIDKISENLDGYEIISIGTFNSRYPQRNIKIKVIRGFGKEKGNFEDAKEFKRLGLDFQFNLILNSCDTDNPGNLKIIDDNYINLYLNLNHKPQMVLPEDLKKLQDFVNPEFVTPMLMLSLIKFFDICSADNKIQEGDRQEIDYLRERLLSNAIMWLFTEHIGNKLGYNSVGKNFVKDIFIDLCQKKYPDYNTFILTADFKEAFSHYINALSQLNIREKRGHQPITGPKDDIALLFGSSKHSTFKSKLDYDYKDVIERVNWEGKNGLIELKLHPLEAYILNEIRISDYKYNGLPAKKMDDLAEISRTKGYLADELIITLQLLQARLYIQTEEKGDDIIVFLTNLAPTDIDIEKINESINTNLQKVKNISNESIFKTLEAKQKTYMQNYLPSHGNEEEIYELYNKLLKLNKEIIDLIKTEKEQLIKKLGILMGELDGHMRDLKQMDSLNKEISGTVSFVGHLNDSRRKLVQKRDALRKNLNIEKVKINKAITDNSDDRTDSVMNLCNCLKDESLKVKEFVEIKTEINDQISDLNKWKMLLENIDNLYKELKYEHTDDVRNELDRLISLICEEFIKNNLDALKNRNIFIDKFNDVSNMYKNRFDDKNRQFSYRKDIYQKLLKDNTGVKDPQLVSRYTFGEDQESYSSLFLEIMLKVEERLKELKIGLDDIRIDILKAEHIQEQNKDIVEQASRVVKKYEDELDVLQKQVSLENIENEERFKKIIDDIKLLFENINNTQVELRRAIHSTEFPLSQEESEVLQLFDIREEKDVIDIFVKARKSGKNISLRKFIETIEGLYSKNRVVIRVKRHA